MSYEHEDEDFLSVPERFDALLVGRWQEDADCTSGENVLELQDTRLRYGDLVCESLDLSNRTAHVNVSLSQCRVEGVPGTDREYTLDTAGTDILYLTGDDLPRTRLERCAEG